jgi:acyl carrier protein
LTVSAVRKAWLLMSTAVALRSLIAEKLHVDIDELTTDTRFDELGRTSTQELELLTEIEDRFKVTLDFGAYLTAATVGELVEALTAALRAGDGRFAQAGSA